MFPDALAHPVYLHIAQPSHQLTSLSAPQPRNQLGDANVVRLEGVQSKTEGDGTGAEGPVGSGADLGDTLLGEVIDDAGPSIFVSI